MVKIDRVIFGYRKINVNVDLLASISSILVQNRIQAEIKDSGIVFIRERDYEKFLRCCKNKIEFSASETLGWYGEFKKINHKVTVFITTLIMLFVILFSSNLVWDVRISGNSTVSDSKIVYALSDLGLEIGAFWNEIEKNKIENEFLMLLEDIGWININRRGSVAYVEVVENSYDEFTEDVSSKKYSNIVATDDCVIEEITVVKGTAIVKPGDVVKKGDLLISGVLTSDEGLCKAEGTVKGRLTDRVVVTTERSYKIEQEKRERLYSLTLNLFNFSINIFKIYGNLAEECDIIEDVKEYSFFGMCKLPFGITREYSQRYTFTDGLYSDSEIVEITSVKLASAVHSRLISADLYKIKTYGEFTETGYKMYSDLVFCAEIGRAIEISVD